jgi:hypothetical protein
MINIKIINNEVLIILHLYIICESQQSDDRHLPTKLSYIKKYKLGDSIQYTNTETMQIETSFDEEQESFYESSFKERPPAAAHQVQEEYP